MPGDDVQTCRSPALVDAGGLRIIVRHAELLRCRACSYAKAFDLSPARL